MFKSAFAKEVPLTSIMSSNKKVRCIAHASEQS